MEVTMLRWVVDFLGFAGMSVFLMAVIAAMVVATGG